MNARESNAHRRLEKLTDVSLPTAEHRLRRRLELDWVERNGWSRSLLDTRRAIHRAKSSGVYVGPGVGSTEASLLLYCMGLTYFDPVRYGLFPGLFYRTRRDTHHSPACFSVSEVMTRTRHYREESILVELARSGQTRTSTEFTWPTAKELTKLDLFPASKSTEHTTPRETGETPRWSFQTCPSARWVFKRYSGRGYEDLLCAIAISRPGPSGSGMVQSYIEAAERDQAATSLSMLHASRGVPLFREQLYEIGECLLELDIDGSRRFAVDLLKGRAETWMPALNSALKRHTGDRQEARRLSEVLIRFAPYLYPRAHTLSRAWLLVQRARLHLAD